MSQLLKPHKAEIRKRTWRAYRKFYRLNPGNFVMPFLTLFGGYVLGDRRFESTWSFSRWPLYALISAFTIALIDLGLYLSIRNAYETKELRRMEAREGEAMLS